MDAAAVYVNASMRFTDGFEFGFGAEIGISTQKLHARGPMGLLALTSTKYIIYGDGQIRNRNTGCKDSGGIRQTLVMGGEAKQRNCSAGQKQFADS